MTESAQGLLDTSVIIDHDLIDPARLPDESAISAITLAELAAGPPPRKIPTSALDARIDCSGRFQHGTPYPSMQKLREHTAECLRLLEPQGNRVGGV